MTQDQIDIYAARGLLIESDRAWLWGTSVEHCVLYQYQISNAQNIVLGMIQTESPYFQPIPKAPQPFATGLFSNDPVFPNCSPTDARCAFSWAARIVDSSSIYMLGAGLYSWFSDYSKTCVDSDNCQARGFEVEQSSDIWIYNLCTKAIEEMISPVDGTPTYARDNTNGFLASILAWLQGSNNVGGKRRFDGYQVWTPGMLEFLHLEMILPPTCISALTEVIRCDPLTKEFMIPKMRGSPGDKNKTDSVCDAGCGQDLKKYFDGVTIACAGYQISDALPAMRGGRIWAGYNETCLKNPTTGQYCNGKTRGPRQARGSQILTTFQTSSTLSPRLQQSRTCLPASCAPSAGSRTTQSCNDRATLSTTTSSNLS